MADFPLGRFEPTDFKHIDKYPLRMRRAPFTGVAERLLPLPHHYRRKQNQGSEGACVGFSQTWQQLIYNVGEGFLDGFWLYEQAKKIDEWQGEDYDGTSLRAGFDVLRTVGHLRKDRRFKSLTPQVSYGIVENRWATTVDEIRAAIMAGDPVNMGTNWYSGFDEPEKRGREFWVSASNVGYLRGGHAWTIYGASDRRQAFKMVNSWGMDYPLVWFPYDLVGRLLNEYGEAGIVTDRRAE